MGWLRKMPIVSLLFAAAMAAVPFLLAQQPADRLAAGQAAGFENAQTEAREYLARNPRLEIDALGVLMLGPEWLTDFRVATAAESAEGSSDVVLPPRLLARSQAQFDELLDEVYRARLSSDPAWRFGVLDAKTPDQNYIAHAFVHEQLAGAFLCVAVLLLIGAPLETRWGSPIMAVFVLSAIPLVAQGYRLLDGSSGIPWSGGTGLAGALLGAYFIRGLGGHFRLPGWILLPVWIAVEALVVRGFWLDDLGGVPWATICASIGLGASVAGVIRLLNIEGRIDDAAHSRQSRGPNPIVARAARMRSDGDPYQAFDLIQAAWRDAPEDEDICEAFYSIACEIGQPDAAADAILPSLRGALRAGDFSRAVDYWFPLAKNECEVGLEPTAYVRLAEALLDASHVDEALFSLRGAMAAGVSSGHATRIVHIARDLDEDLARQAASIAVADPHLDPKIRAELEGIALGPEPTAAPTPSPAPPPESASQLDRRVHAEHQTVETTAFPMDLDTDLVPDLGEAMPIADSNEDALADQSLDAGALSLESLSGGVAETPDLTPEPIAPNTSDVLSHWGDQDGLEADTLSDVSAALDDGDLEEALFEPDDLETPEMGFDFGLRSGGDDLLDGLGSLDLLDDETDSDLTPLMDATDATDELTSPLADPALDTSTAVFDQPTVMVGAPTPTPAPAAAPAAASPPPAPTASPSDFAFGGEDPPTVALKLRPLKAIDAVPVDATPEAIEIDAVGRGKSKLPRSRLEAISVAAIEGLGPRPVLIVDCVLNWAGEATEPMKLIRFRSDRFDPLLFAPEAETPLIALNCWISELQSGANAQCLPTREILDGRFPRYASLVDYEREVLGATAED